MQTNNSTQDAFLIGMRERKRPVIIYLMNGFQFSTPVEVFDSFSLIVRNKDRRHLIFKHAISTIETP
jgi:host factor-I protein